MNSEISNGTLVCAGTLGVDDAEALQQQLLAAAATTPGLALDLAACGHVHSACLQVLMASGARVAAWPEAPALAAWLRASLNQSTTTGA